MSLIISRSSVDDKGRANYCTSPAFKSYYDKKEQQYKRTTSFYGSENLAVAKLYYQADDRIAELEEADYQRSKATEG